MSGNRLKKPITKGSMASFVLFLGLFSCLIFPSIQIGSIKLYLTTLIAPLIFFMWLYFVLSRKRKILHKFTIPIALLSLMVLLSASFSQILGQSTHNIGNYVESIKYLQFFPYLALTPFLSSRTNVSIIKNFFIFSIVLISVVGLIQLSSYLDISKYITLLYLDEASSHAAFLMSNDASSKRITLTGSDPNVGGAIAGFLSLYCLVILASGKKRAFLLALFLLLYLALQTQSRTVAMAVALSGIISLLFLSNIKPIYKIYYLSLIVLASYFIWFLNDFQYIKVGYELFASGDNSSVNSRIENIENSFSIFKSSPLFGIGPSKNETSTIIDSEYALILQRYGVFGVMVFIYTFYILLSAGLKNRNLHSGKLLLTMIPFAIVVMFTNNIFSGYQLMSIYIIMLCYCLSDKKA